MYYVPNSPIRRVVDDDAGGGDHAAHLVAHGAGVVPGVAVRGASEPQRGQPVPVQSETLSPGDSDSLPLTVPGSGDKRKQ